MSETSGTLTSVLLPAARVSLFVLDKEIGKAAEELRADWRFARVTIDVQSGSVEDAIELYKTQTSPELVIVETPTIEGAFTKKLEDLAGNCAAGTSAVVIGPVNDVYLYRKMIDMGVSDYLVRPLGKEVLAEVISKTLLSKLGTSDSRMIAVIGAKGGVGVSTLAQGLAWTTSDKLDQKTIILDAAGGWSYLCVGLGQEPITTLSEVSRAMNGSDQDSFKRTIIPVTDKLSVLASGADAMLDDVIPGEGFEAIVNRLMAMYPVVIVDLSAASASVRRSVLTRAHEVVLVSTPTLPSLRAARSLLLEIRTLRGGSDKEITFVLNKEGENDKMEVAKSDIEIAMDRKPAVIFPFLPKAFVSAENQCRKIFDVPESVPLLGNFMALAGLVLRQEGLWDALQKKSATSSPSGDDSGFLGGLLGKLKAK
jgi:pilus assembly protein CpaE